MVIEMKDKCATKAEYVYVSEIKKSHEKFFHELRKCFTENSYPNVFINAIIGDYLYDINQKYEIEEESFRQYIISNWGRDFKDYCDNLVESVNNAKKIVINTYFLYFRNRQDILSIPLELINDVSMEFYTLDSYKPYKQVSTTKIANLPKEEKTELIRIIDKVDNVLANYGGNRVKTAISL